MPKTLPAETEPSGNDAQLARDPLFVGSLAKAFRVLECFCVHPAAMTLREIADRSGLGMSTAQRFVYTLQKLGYLDKDEPTRVYRPSLKALGLVHAFMRADRVSELATPYLLALAGQCNETVNLMMLDLPYSVYVLRMPRRELRNPQALIGARLLAHRSTSGLAMMGLLSGEETSRALELMQRVDPSLADSAARSQVLAALESGRDKGYVLDDEATTPGEIAVSAAFRVKHSGRLAAVLVPIAASRWTRARVEAELAPAIVECARSIDKVVNLR